MTIFSSNCQCRAHHKNQRVVESKKISNDYKNSIYGLSLMRNIFLHKIIYAENYLFNRSFKGRLNLIQIPTTLKMSQNNVKKCGKRFSQLTNTKCDVFFFVDFWIKFSSNGDPCISDTPSELLRYLVKKPWSTSKFILDLCHQNLKSIVNKNDWGNPTCETLYIRRIFSLLFSYAIFERLTKDKLIDLLPSTPDLINARSDIDLQFDRFKNFRQIDPTIFNDMVYLEKISFAKMARLESLDENLFKGLTNLTELVMCQNQLASLPEKIFQDTKKLAYLSICEQPMKKIHD